MEKCVIEEQERVRLHPWTFRRHIQSIRVMSYVLIM